MNWPIISAVLLGAEFRLLSAVGVPLQEQGLLDNQEALVKYLEQQNKNNAFTLTDIKGPDGKAVFSTAVSYPILFLPKMRNTPTNTVHYISSRRKGPFTGKDILVFAVPLPQRDGERGGLVFATQTIEFYATTLSANATHGQG